MKRVMCIFVALIYTTVLLASCASPEGVDLDQLSIGMTRDEFCDMVSSEHRVDWLHYSFLMSDRGESAVAVFDEPDGFGKYTPSGGDVPLLREVQVLEASSATEETFAEIKRDMTVSEVVSTIGLPYAALKHYSRYVLDFRAEAGGNYRVIFSEQTLTVVDTARLISEEMVSQIKPGMTRQEVVAVLGAPVGDLLSVLYPSLHNWYMEGNTELRILFADVLKTDKIIAGESYQNALEGTTTLRASNAYYYDMGQETYLFKAEVYPVPEDFFAPISTEGISSRDLAQIQEGMTFEDVIALIGKPQENLGYGSCIFRWDLADGGEARIAFEGEPTSQEALIVKTCKIVE